MNFGIRFETENVRKLLKSFTKIMSRGPYKRYEYDASVPVPKTTSYNRRKRNYDEVAEAENVSTLGDDSSRTVGNILLAW